jgi:hypothetical protein
MNPIDGGPAFPIGSGDMRDPFGMSLRDYFAAKAMQGLIVGVENPRTDYIARAAYAMADAMLRARQEPQP